MVIYYCYTEEFQLFMRNKKVSDDFADIIEIVTKPVSFMNNKLTTFFVICKTEYNGAVNYAIEYVNIKSYCPSLKCPYYDNICESVCEHALCISLQGVKGNVIDHLCIASLTNRIKSEDLFRNYYSLSMFEFNSKYFTEHVKYFTINIRSIDLVNGIPTVYFYAILDEDSYSYEEYASKHDCKSGINFTSILDRYQFITLKCYGASENTNWNLGIISNEDMLQHYKEHGVVFNKYPVDRVPSEANIISKINSEYVLVRELV